MKSTKAPTRYRILRAITGSGLKEPPASISFATANAPVIDPQASTIIQTLGIDAVPFSFALGATPLPIVFPNLPKRDNTANPLRLPQLVRPTLTILPKDFLLFIAFIQELTAPPGVTLSVTPQAQVNTTPQLTVSGPFLGSNTFRLFQATLAVNAAPDARGTVSGTIVGMLFLSVG